MWEERGAKRERDGATYLGTYVCVLVLASTYVYGFYATYVSVEHAAREPLKNLRRPMADGGGRPASHAVQ